MSHPLTEFVEANENRVTKEEAVEEFAERRGSREAGNEYVEYWLDELDNIESDRFGGKDRIERLVY